MKKILIPTDFTTDSLQLIEYAILNFADETLEIVLVHGYKMPDGYTEIRNFSPSKIIFNMADSAFEQEKNTFLREHKNRVLGIRYDLFTGSNSFAFQNFILQLKIDGAIVPNKNFLSLPRTKSFDVIPLIKKNVPDFYEVNLGTNLNGFQKKNGSILDFLS